MNWGELKAAVAGYTHRDDLDALFPTFLQLAEQRIYIGEVNSPKVRVAAMRQFATLANGTRPSGFLEAIKVNEASSPDKTLDFCPLNRLSLERRAFSWDGQTLVLSDDQGFPLDLTYYAKLTTPVADSDSNWLTENAPSVYLASLLVEAYRWAMDDQAAAREANNYASAVNSLNSQDRAAQSSGSRLIVRGGR
ncbi:hypothetical protein [Acidovorax sp.]|uniref:phage adaptor protein n=1 Tax=Acidovorax sp. TaxID=1872122 RepID=UPI003919BF56